MKTILKLSFLFLFIHNTIAQVNNDLLFKVLDKETNEPVAYATVMVKEINRGTHADTDGFFEIPIEYSQNYSITISSIGYISKEILLSSIKDRSLITIIYLNPANTVLEEIVVKSKRKKNKENILAYTIVKKAIEKIPENYPTKPFSYVGYYRDYQQPLNDDYKNFINSKNDIDYVNLHEGIIEVFDNGFGTNQLTDNNNQTVLYSFKTNTDFKVDTTLTIPYDNTFSKFSNYFKITPLGGNELNLLNLTNAVRNYNKMSFSFANVFQKDFLENHEFRKKSLKYFDDELLYEIDFKTKKQSKRVDYFANGKIYINKKSYAIHKLTYNLYFGNTNNLQYSVTSEFQKKEDKMYLNYITFNNFFMAKSSDFFKVSKVTLDVNSFSFKIELNKEIDEKYFNSLQRKINIIYKDKFLKISNVKILNNKTLKVFLDTSQTTILREKDEADFGSRFEIELKNIKDINGYKINKTVDLKFNQYRELFVQEIFTDKKITNEKEFVNKSLPLSESKISPSSFKEAYWMNTPLKKTKKN